MIARKVGVVVYPLLHDRVWMTTKHHMEGLDAVAIARCVGCTTATARNALIALGLYQPQRRPREIRVLEHVDAERLRQDARRSSSWRSLAGKYCVQRCVVQDHAIFLGVFDELPGYFDPRNKLTYKKELEPNEFLGSREWIVSTFMRRYRIRDVADEAGVPLYVVNKWLSLHEMTVAEMRDARNRAICLEYEMGAMLGELALSFRIDPAGIYRILREGGCDTTRRKGRSARRRASSSG